MEAPVRQVVSDVLQGSMAALMSETWRGIHHGPPLSLRREKNFNVTLG